MSKKVFSVIIPIYNVEEYLAETIDSVINQTVGLDKIEIILVNDGSKDNSKAICEQYVKKYPKTVVYIEQKNSGVSAARNNGLDHAKGKYVNYLDSDDCWQEDVFEKVERMFEENPQVDIIGVRQKNFEANHRFDALDYKYKDNEDGVYDITEHDSFIQLSVTSGFFRIEAAKTARFDERIKYSEDAKYIYDITINRKNKYLGLIGSSFHFYRKRFAQTSAIQTKDNKKDWYQQTVKLSYMYLLDRCKKEFPEILRTIMTYIIFDYQWRYKADLDKVIDFSDKEKKQYIEDTIFLYKNSDDDIILRSQFLTVLAKQHVLLLKYDHDETKMLEERFKYTSEFPVQFNINYIDIKDDRLRLKGIVDLLYSKKIELYCINNKKHKIDFKRDATQVNYHNVFNEKVNKCEFDFEMDLEKNNNIKFIARVNKKEYVLKPAFYKHLHVQGYKGAYKRIDKYNLKKKPKGITLNKKTIFFNEVLLLGIMFLKRRFRSLLYRLCYRMNKLFKKKEIWLICDRVDVAGDNAEALFKYISKVKPENVDYYFVLNKDSKDVERIKKYGKVLYYNSCKYVNKFLLCDKLISSHFDDHVFGSKKIDNYLLDLTNYKYIFLQHGVTYNNISPLINKFIYDVSLFTTVSDRETDLIVNDERFGYGKDIVKPLGFARYDKLIKPKKMENVILLAPTWRAGLKLDNIGGYIEGFKKTDFYILYNKLISDKRILDSLKKYNYKIRFCLHYRLRSQIVDFKNSKYVDFITDPNYSKEIINSKALITDYSSLSFDFAYLGKPIIYNNQDKESFYKQQFYTEYPEERPNFLFGDVVYDYETLVNKIVELIKNDCKNSKEYIDKSKKFFKHHDTNNCKRIYEEILKIK